MSDIIVSQKQALKLLNRVHNAIEDGIQVADLPDIQGALSQCIAELYIAIQKQERCYAISRGMPNA